MGKAGKNKGRDERKAEALENIALLVKLAKKEAGTDAELAREYARTAYRIAQKARCGIPREFSLAICRKCLYVRQFGKNTKAAPDAKTGSVVYACSCGAKQRFYYKGMPKQMGKKEKQKTG